MRRLLTFRIFGLSKLNRESRRADSNRLPSLFTRTNRYISGCMRLLQNPISKPNTRTSNIVEQPEIWPGWCTNGVRAQHLWQPFWCRAPSVGVSRPRLASLGPADTVSPFVRRDFLELAVYCGDEGPEVLVAEGVGYKGCSLGGTGLIRSGRSGAGGSRRRWR